MDVSVLVDRSAVGGYATADAGDSRSGAAAGGWQACPTGSSGWQRRMAWHEGVVKPNGSTPNNGEHQHGAAHCSRHAQPKPWLEGMSKAPYEQEPQRVGEAAHSYAQTWTALVAPVLAQMAASAPLL